jgi:hypothetical protein
LIHKDFYYEKSIKPPGLSKIGSGAAFNPEREFDDKTIACIAMGYFIPAIDMFRTWNIPDNILTIQMNLLYAVFMDAGFDLEMSGVECDYMYSILKSYMLPSDELQKTMSATIHREELHTSLSNDKQELAVKQAQGSPQNFISVFILYRE